MLLVGIASILLSQQKPSNEVLTWFWDRRTDPRVARRIQDAYKLDDKQYLALSEKVTRRMIEPTCDYVPGVSIQTRAKQLQSAVLDVVQVNEPSANELLKERMVAQGIYDWTRTHILYNLWLGDLTHDRNIRKNYWLAEDLFKLERPNAVCAGIANVMAKLANSIGIEAINVNGTARRNFESTNLPTDINKVGHQWVLIRQKDGFLFPADPTNSGVSLAKARELNGKIADPITFPILPEDWSLYLAVYNATAIPWTKPPLPTNDDLLSLKYDQWRVLDVRALKQAYSRRTGMTWFSTACVTWPLDH